MFAAPESRAALLGVYALVAEWRALIDPSTEMAVARLKLGWWQEEMQRLAAGRPVHPISVYLAGLKGAAAADFSPLMQAVEAAEAHLQGAPLERGADLEAHSWPLWGEPLMQAARLAAPDFDAASVRGCGQALAAADYLSRAIDDYGREARRGRVSFAVDELLAAGIENADLCAVDPPARLQDYLERSRRRTRDYFALAARTLPAAQASAQRHLLVLAALGAARMDRPKPASERWRLQDMLLSWSTARRANR